MSDIPTPGQVCYERYWRAYTPHLDLLPWDGLSANNHAAWEAAAEAVLDAWHVEQYEGMKEHGAPGEPPEKETPHDPS